MGIKGIKKYLMGASPGMFKWSPTELGNATGAYRVLVDDAMHPLYRILNIKHPRMAYLFLMQKYLRFCKASRNGAVIVITYDNIEFIKQKSATQQKRDKQRQASSSSSSSSSSAADTETKDEEMYSLDEDIDAASAVSSPESQTSPADIKNIVVEDELQADVKETLTHVGPPSIPKFKDFAGLFKSGKSNAVVHDYGITVDGKEYTLDLVDIVCHRPSRRLLYKYFAEKLEQDWRIPAHSTIVLDYETSKFTVIRGGDVTQPNRVTHIKHSLHIGESDLKLVFWIKWLWHRAGLPCMIHSIDSDMFPMFRYHFDGLYAQQFATTAMTRLPKLAWQIDHFLTVDVVKLIAEEAFSRSTFMRACIFSSTDYFSHTDVFKQLGQTTSMPYFRAQDTKLTDIQDDQLMLLTAPDHRDKQHQPHHYVDEKTFERGPWTVFRRDVARLLDRSNQSTKLAFGNLTKATFEAARDRFVFNYQYWATLDNQADQLQEATEFEGIEIASPEGITLEPIDPASLQAAGIERIQLLSV